MKIKKLLSRSPKTVITPGDYVSSGSTMLNMALTGDPKKGFLRGHYYRFVGDSGSGKTLILITCFAEANKLEMFKDYNFVFDAPEDGAGFDMEKFFGKSVSERIVPPAGTPENPVYSETVEDFYDYLDTWMKKGPCIYVLDSMDCISSVAEDAKYEKQKSSREVRRRGGKGQAVAGSMGMDKMKVNSQYLRRIMPLLRKTKSILMVISQTRDKTDVGFMPSYPGAEKPKVAGGGHALKFYGRCEIWLSVKKKIYSDNVRGKKWEQGIVAACRTRKNRQTGKDWTVMVPIYHSIGIDDTGSCIDYLIDVEEWKESTTGMIAATDFNVKKNREELVAYIEEKPSRMKLLRTVVRRVWKDIVNKTSITRKQRYQ